jgi:hypothetical protein
MSPKDPCEKAYSQAVVLLGGGGTFRGGAYLEEAKSLGGMPMKGILGSWILLHSFFASWPP